MIKQTFLTSGKFAIVTILVFLAKCALFGILHSLGENIANTIAVVIGTVLRYGGHRSFTWKDNVSEKSFGQYLKLEGPFSLGEIFLFPALKALPIWDNILSKMEIDSPLSGGYLVLLAIGVILTIVSFFYHKNVTFEEGEKQTQNGNV